MIGAFYFLRGLTQTAYRIKGIGMGRVCEFIRRWASRHAPAEPLIIQDFRGDGKFRCFLNEHMGSQIFFRGSYSGDQLSILERILNTDSVFLDVGANQGEFSIAAARIVQQGKVIAFEPVSEWRNRLVENVKLNNFQNVQVIPIALGEKEGEFPIYESQKSFNDGTWYEGLSTLFAQDSRHHVRGKVLVRKLDNILEELAISRVDVIKLDIEGAEWIALRGAAKTITRDRPVLILEIGRDTCRAAGYEPEALIEWLTGLNYRIEKITEKGETLLITPDLLGDFQNVIAYPA